MWSGICCLPIFGAVGAGLVSRFEGSGLGVLVIRMVVPHDTQDAQNTWQESCSTWRIKGA